MTRPTQTNPVSNTETFPQEKRHLTLIGEKTDVIYHNLANANQAYSEELKALADLSLGNDATIIDDTKSVTSALKEQLSTIESVEEALNIVSQQIQDSLFAAKQLTAEGQTAIENSVGITERLKTELSVLKIRSWDIFIKCNLLNNWLYRTFLEEDD